MTKEIKIPTFKRETKTLGDELFDIIEEFLFCDNPPVPNEEINRQIKEVLETTMKEGHSRISMGDTVVSGHRWTDGSIDIDVCTSDGRYYLGLPSGVNDD